MNKNYIIKEDGEVIVISDKGDIETREYTKNTDEILSLENSEESLSLTVKLIQKRYNELNNNVRRQKKNTRILNIMLSLCLPLILVVGAMITVELLLSILLLSVPIAIATGITEKIIIDKSVKKREECSTLLVDKQKLLEKIQKQIEKLSLDKTKTKTTEPNQVIEVKRITDYKFNTEDYFIERYKIDKRTREMEQESKNTKKLIRKRKYKKTDITW